MSLLSSNFGQLPGMGSPVYSFENAPNWGPYPVYFVGAYISPNAVDSGNSPTSTLRAGLVMAKQTATGQWSNYSPTATDGTQLALGVLPVTLRLQDILSETNQAKFYAILVGGAVKASFLFGLDNQARGQMATAFLFDDNYSTYDKFPFLFEAAKTANYTLQATDNFGLFTNAGATGAVTFTLPPIANGYAFYFRAVANQNLAVTSNEGANIVALNNAAANTLTFSTGSQIIGGGLLLTSNGAGTKWYADNISAGANTVTVS